MVKPFGHVVFSDSTQKSECSCKDNIHLSVCLKFCQKCVGSILGQRIQEKNEDQRTVVKWGQVEG